MNTNTMSNTNNITRPTPARCADTSNPRADPTDQNATNPAAATTPAATRPTRLNAYDSPWPYAHRTNPAAPDHDTSNSDTARPTRARHDRSGGCTARANASPTSTYRSVKNPPR